MKSILIGTPAYGGQVTTQYALSLAATMNFQPSDLNIAVHMIANESLVHRARNKIVAKARMAGFSHLLFIDADLKFYPIDIHNLVAAEKAVIGGTYPVKKLPIKLNHNSYEPPKVEGRLEQVKHLPTGFMLIDLNVFDFLERFVPSCQKQDLTTGEVIKYVEFFRAGIHRGQDLSEDWYFSELCAENGITPWLHHDVVLPHVGSFEYQA